MYRVCTLFTCVIPLIQKTTGEGEKGWPTLSLTPKGRGGDCLDRALPVLKHRRPLVELLQHVLFGHTLKGSHFSKKLSFKKLKLSNNLKRGEGNNQLND